MTTIDPNSAQAALFEKLGITKQSEAQKASKDTLGQSDFLKLMTTQLQNQDPFAPMDNGDFIAQMAQFSTVTGIEEVNSSLKKLVEEFDQARIATASNLLGHAIKNIKKGEEFSYDYGFSFDEDYKKYPCKCGSKNCCGYIIREGSRWRIKKNSKIKK